jgi:adhesin transport system outer membrane protein
MKRQRPVSLRPLGMTMAMLMLLALPLTGGQSAFAEEPSVTISDSVAAALGYNPRLKVLQANHEAVGFELERARGGYFPRIDVSAGYGAESYSDELTRSKDTENNFYDRMEASIRLKQLLYDGRETTSRVDAEAAKLDSARYRVLDNAEAIALDAIIAHMEVYRQRALAGLAEQNVQDHEDILGMLNERQKAGVGSIADVTQTQGRLARARASFAEISSGVKSAEANYQRIVGKPAGNVEYFTIPANQVPKSLDEVVQAVQVDNPKVKALEFNIQEAESRIGLSDSSFLPKVNLELSSSYEDQVESSDTYEQGNQAMIRLNWNLFNGGSDVADRKAAVARKFQAVNSKDDQLVLAVEEAVATWAKLEAFRQQIVDFGDATSNSRKTVDAYLKQFSVGQRTLLDVLDARNELFQSSGLLVTARVNEVIATERLLALTGSLNRSLGMDTRLLTAASK